MKNNSIRRLTAAAALTAAVCLVTLLSVRLPGATEGYVHFGDAVIYLLPFFLPLPYALGAACVGASLADLMLGAPVWIFATVPIKAALVLVFSGLRRQGEIFSRGSVLRSLACVLITCAGYYIGEVIIVSSWTAPLFFILFNAIQALASGALFLAAGRAIDKTGMAKYRVK